jgi:uncharacterized hydrophobic protein (TIGR00341 family)
MKLVKVIARTPKEKKQIIEMLKKKNIVSYDFVTTGSNFYKFEITATDQETGGLLSELENAGFGKSFENSITVMDVKASVPPRRKKELAPIISEEEIEADIKRGAALNWIFVSFVSLSAIIIALGLLGNNIIVVIGGMLIAPILYPIIGTSYYLMRGNFRKTAKTLYSEAFGVLLAIFWGMIIAEIVNSPSLNPLLIGRATITLFDVGIAIFAGAAGALSVATRNLGEFSGVAITVALIPPAVAIGIGIGISNMILLSGAIGLTLINLVGVHLASILTFSILGYTN